MFTVYKPKAVCRILTSLTVNIYYNHLYSLAQPEPSKTSLLVISQSSLRENFSRLLKDIPKLFFGCWLPFVWFSVKMIPHCLSNVNVRSLGRIHHSLKLVATDFQSSSWVIWHTSAFSSRFDEASVNSRWIIWTSRCISQVLCQVDFIFSYCSYTVDRVLNLPPLMLLSTCPVTCVAELEASLGSRDHILEVLGSSWIEWTWNLFFKTSPLPLLPPASLLQAKSLWHFFTAGKTLRF